MKNINIMKYSFFFCCFVLIVQALSAGPLHQAAVDGNLEKVKALLADNIGQLETTNEQNRTALHLAAGGGFLEITQYLLDAGANIEAQDDRHTTPLLMAVFNNHLPVVRLLADRRANLKAEHDSYGKAIEIAYWQECIKGRSGITEFLISRGVPFDPNDESAIATRINLATTFGNYEMAQFAINLGADVNKVSTSDGMTELHFAVYCGYADIVRLLIEHGANPHVTNNDGVPPIWHAVSGGHTNIVKILLERNTPVNYIDPSNGQTLLHAASVKGYLDIVQLLLPFELGINARDNNGHSSIYYAGKYGHTQVSKLLSEKGAIPPDDMIDNYSQSSSLDQTLSPGEAVAWALCGRGWAIKTAQHMLIIDDIQKNRVPPTEPSLANGFIRATQIADQNLYVMYSTFHWPDLVEYIHQIEDSLPKVTYIHNEKETWRGCKHTVYVKADETRNFDDLKLRTIQATYAQPSLGYYCEVDGVKFYYCVFNTDDKEAFNKDLDSLAATFGTLDIAFVPLPSFESGEDASLKMIIEKLRPKAVCFSIPGWRSNLYPDVSKKFESWGYQIKLFGPEYPGDQFIYRTEP